MGPNFWNGDAGQDLIEYSLLISFLALACVTLFIGAGAGVQGIWSSTNSQLTVAKASDGAN